MKSSGLKKLRRATTPKILREPFFEKQAGESSQAWSAFQTYRDAQPEERSYAKVAEATARSRRLVERFASRWSWRARAAAFDAQADKAAREKWQRERIELKREQLAVGRALVAEGVRWLQHADSTEWKAKDGVRVLELGFRLQQLTFGEATEIKGRAETAEEAHGRIVRAARQTLVVERELASANLSNAMLRRMCSQTFGVQETDLQTDSELDALVGKPRVIEALDGLGN